MEILQETWKQHLRPRAVVGYGVKIFLPSPQSYVTRSPGMRSTLSSLQLPSKHFNFKRIKEDIFINSLYFCVFVTLTILLFVGIDRNEYRQGMMRQILLTLTLRLIKTMT